MKRLLKKALLILHTLKYLRPVQIINRVWRKLPSFPGTAGKIEMAHAKPAVPFPAYFPTWNGNNEFTFIGEKRQIDFPCGWNDKSLKKLWLYNLHYFDYLRQADNTPATLQPGLRPALPSQAYDGMPQWREGRAPSRPRQNGEQAASGLLAAKIQIMQKWIDENPVGKGNGWEPYPLSLRIVNWIKFLSVTKVPEDKQSVLLSSLALQTASLARQLEYHLLANHLLANAKALVFAGKFFKGKLADKWYRKGISIYKKELAEQVLADGVHFERSAMYHSIIFEDILDCLNFTGESLFREYANRMLAGLNLLTGPDGQISLFNDAAFGIALEPCTLHEYAKALSVTPPVTNGDTSRNSGFAKLQNGMLTLLAKCGEIGPSYQPGHAHADSLSFELWNGGTKIITDTGTDRYVIDPERLRQRSTSAHNTVIINGKNSSEVWAGHRVARRAKSTLRSQTANSLSAEHNGYASIIHRRTLELNGNVLRGRDEILANGNTSSANIEIRFHLARGITHDDIEIECDKGMLSFEPCDIAIGFGKTVQSECAIIGIKSATLPIEITWTICMNNK